MTTNDPTLTRLDAVALIGAHFESLNRTLGMGGNFELVVGETAAFQYALGLANLHPEYAHALFAILSSGPEGPPFDREAYEDLMHQLPITIEVER